MRSQFSKTLFASSILILAIAALIAGAYTLQVPMQLTGKGAIAWVAAFDFRRDPGSYDYILISVKNLGSKPVAICLAIFDVTGNLWRSSLVGDGSATWTMTGCSDSKGSPWNANGVVGSTAVWTIRFQPVLPTISPKNAWTGEGTVLVYSEDSVTLISPTAVMASIGRSRTTMLQWLPAENMSVTIVGASRPVWFSATRRVSES